MSPGPHSAKAMPGTLASRLGVGEGAHVFDLQAEQQLAVRVQRPRVGALQILGHGQAPDLGRMRLAAAATSANVQRLNRPC